MGITMIRVVLSTLILFIPLCFFDASYAMKAKKPPVDKDEIKRLAERDFDSIINLWNAERYEELYGYGALSGHARISKEDFIIRMGQKKFKLMCCGDAAREIEVIYRSPSVVYVKARMGYKNNINKEAFRHETFRLSFEDGKWRIDLLKILKGPDSKSR